MGTREDNFEQAKTEFENFQDAVLERLDAWKLAGLTVCAAFTKASDDVSAALSENNQRQAFLNQFVGSVVTVALAGGFVWLLEGGVLALVLGEALVKALKEGAGAAVQEMGKTGIGEVFSATGPQWAGMNSAADLTSPLAFTISVQKKMTEADMWVRQLFREMRTKEFQGEFLSNAPGRSRWQHYRQGFMTRLCEGWLQGSRKLRDASDLPAPEVMIAEFKRLLWARVAATRSSLGLLPRITDSIPDSILTALKNTPGMPVESFMVTVVMRCARHSVGREPDPIEYSQRVSSMQAFAAWGEQYRGVDLLSLGARAGTAFQDECDLPALKQDVLRKLGAELQRSCPAGYEDLRQNIQQPLGTTGSANH